MLRRQGASRGGGITQLQQIWWLSLLIYHCHYDADEGDVDEESESDKASVKPVLAKRIQKLALTLHQMKCLQKGWKCIDIRTGQERVQKKMENRCLPKPAPFGNWPKIPSQSFPSIILSIMFSTESIILTSMIFESIIFTETSSLWELALWLMSISSTC